MGKFISVIIAIGAIAVILILGGAFYIVNESEQVVITQFNCNSTNSYNHTN
jgi:regulator of protease activity HflC (stomatin/prohibitin superfamily)